MKKKLLATLLTTAMAASMLTGCGDSATTTTTTASSEAETTAATEVASAAAEETVAEEEEEWDGEVIELEFWSWWSSDARKPYIEEMVEGFNESQSKYHVTYVDIPWSDIFTKNIAQIAAGDPCDIMANTLEEVRFRASQGQVEALDDYLEDDVKNSFYSQYLDACTGDDGSIYALPLSVDTRAIYYNKAHFEEAGIDPDDIQTWDDLIEAARKLDVKNGDTWERIGFMPLVGNGGLDTWIINANGGGAGYYDEETLEATVNTDLNKDVFAWVREQIDYYGQDTYNEIVSAYEMQDPFASGVLSMVVHTSAYTSSLASTAPDMEYGIIQLPEYEEGNGHIANGGGFVLEVPKGAKNPEGSYEFIKYVLSRDVQDFLSVSIGDFSARNDFDDTTEFFSNPITVDLAACLEETSTVIVPNELKGYSDVITSYLEEGQLGITSTDDALDAAQEALETFIANNQ